MCIRAVHSSGIKDGAYKYIVTGVQKNSGPKAVRFQAEGVDRESKVHDHNEKTEKRAMNKNSGQSDKCKNLAAGAPLDKRESCDKIVQK